MAQILVTGGSGFIGGWCSLAALQAGHDVRTTVRSLKKSDTLRALLRANADFDDARLDVVEADLQSDAGWREAVAGADYVLHVASPTLRYGPMREEEMISAARGGVLRVLRASRDAGVKRVVLTSASGAVVYGHDPQSNPFTEEDWSNVDAGIPPYQKSKTLAERAAWEFASTEGHDMELTTIQPTGVLGPLLGGDDPPSLRTVSAMLTGALPACPPFGTGWVDVRDVADLHLLAATHPAAAGERFIATSGRSLRMIEVARLLREYLGDGAAKVPTREMPLFAAKVLARISPKMAPLRFQLGLNLDTTAAKAERVLGWKPRTVAESLVDTANSLREHGLATD
ncbi:SDR family oxidoreductase [Mycobacteroides abscessus]|uniref:SDR family oxidoreductase n=1 Tax=Mycobacteroides abscessus TaxID=36809 RepID=UPI0009A58BD1|nr:aldehyde reductase [Mycobacteroides abscessus]MBN7443414.1 aldehyde reductase [Mycobacteroides abscessus subsp. abscessus]RIR87688.1 aldehyde reductase [Mycobacteroides abscessus]SLG56154.1 NAD-dependent epimerase/dehydratase [Mycobacteroides abscessus subsp. abscessus]